MTRKLKPCGTLAAYRRHLDRGEDACGPCLKANTDHSLLTKRKQRRAAVQSRLVTVHSAEMDAALAKRQPVIVWQFDPVRKVQVAVYIDDPHTEREPARRTEAEQERLRAKNEQQRQRRLQRRSEAQTGTDIQVEYIECTDPEILAAARTEI